MVLGGSSSRALLHHSTLKCTHHPAVRAGLCLHSLNSPHTPPRRTLRRATRPPRSRLRLDASFVHTVSIFFPRPARPRRAPRILANGSTRPIARCTTFRMFLLLFCYHRDAPRHVLPPSIGHPVSVCVSVLSCAYALASAGRIMSTVLNRIGHLALPASLRLWLSRYG